MSTTPLSSALLSKTTFPGKILRDRRIPCVLHSSKHWGGGGMRHVAYRFLALIAAVPAFGQAGGPGGIQGTVTDRSGAIVAGATVSAMNLATGVKTDRKTTDAGFFVLSLLPAGE